MSNTTPPNPAPSPKKSRKLPRPSLFIAIGLAIAATAWIASGNPDMLAKLTGADGQPAETNVAETAPVSAKNAEETTAGSEQIERIQSVRIYQSMARNHASVLRVAGRTEASRSGTLSSELEGSIRNLNIENGLVVKAGDLIAQIEVNDRAAAVEEASARVKQREIEFDAASRLAQKGFQSEIRRAEAKAELEAAKSALSRARIELSKTRITAPFDGIIMAKQVEVGDFVAVGDPLATIVDLDPLLVVADVSEREVLGISIGSLTETRLLDGSSVEGVITYIAPQADTSTRTFKIEIEVTGTEGQIKSGVTAEVLLPTANRRAHLISPALLTLNDRGTVGLKSVDDSGRVVFNPVEVIQNSREGLWVAGLPDTLQLISVGQEFVLEGDRVDAVPDTAFMPDQKNPS